MSASFNSLARSALGVYARSFLLVPALLALAVGTNGCSVGVDGSGVIESREKQLDPFDGISISNGFEGRVILSDEFSVLVHADDNLIDDVIISQDGSNVRVTINRKNVSRATLEVDIMVPSLAMIRVDDGSSLEATDLEVEGSLDLSVTDGSHLELSTDSSSSVAYLNLDCEDGSSCEIEANAEEAIIEIRDGSSTRLRGKGKSMTLNEADGSSLAAKSYKVENLNVRLHDASTAEVYVTESVQGKLTDASSLTVHGDPSDVDVSTSDASTVDRP